MKVSRKMEKSPRALKYSLVENRDLKEEEEFAFSCQVHLSVKLSKISHIFIHEIQINCVTWITIRLLYFKAMLGGESDIWENPNPKTLQKIHI